MNPADTSISVTLNLFGDLRRYQPAGESGPARLACASGTTIGELLQRLGIPPGEETAISLNGELASISHVLRDGDEIILFGPSEGG